METKFKKMEFAQNAIIKLIKIYKFLVTVNYQIDINKNSMNSYFIFKKQFYTAYLINYAAKKPNSNEIPLNNTFYSRYLVAAGEFDE